MTTDPIVGDHFLLFTRFPIASELLQETPIQLAPDIYLASTPYHAVTRGARQGSKKEEHVGLGAWVYAGHGLGIGICHSCLKVNATVPTSTALHYAWVMAAALYLAKPLSIHISGFFDYGTPEDGLLGRTPGRIDQHSNICLDTFFSHIGDRPILHYDRKDLERASKCFPIILNIVDDPKQFPRAATTLRKFFKAVLWEKLRFADSIFGELFSSIDSLAGNPTHKHHSKIPTNLSKFLTGTPSLFTQAIPEETAIFRRLQDIWHRHRDADTHGHQKEFPFSIIAGAKIQSSQANDLNQHPEMKDLFDLMEIARAAIVKMLLLDENHFQEYCQIPIPTYVNGKEKTKSIRNDIAATFFAKNYPSSQEVFFYTDLIDAAQMTAMS